MERLFSWIDNIVEVFLKQLKEFNWHSFVEIVHAGEKWPDEGRDILAWMPDFLCQILILS